jgi:hypothetical protein
MSILNYADLVSEVSAYAVREDVTARISTFAQMFEALASKRLRTLEMEKSLALTVTNGVAALPSDFQEWRRVTWDTGERKVNLSYVVPTRFAKSYPFSPTDVPNMFTIETQQVKLMPLATGAVEFDYFGGIPSLEANSTNWLLTKAPEIYLYGVLAEAFGFTRNFDLEARYVAKRDGAFADIERNDIASRGPAAIRVEGPTP